MLLGLLGIEEEEEENHTKLANESRDTKEFLEGGSQRVSQGAGPERIPCDEIRVEEQQEQLIEQAKGIECGRKDSKTGFEEE
jgi:hypothetical protein